MTNKTKLNPNLCTTHESLTKGFASIYRVSGVFEGKARVCSLMHLAEGLYHATTLAGIPQKKVFHLDKVKSGEINIMCIERGE